MNIIVDVIAISIILVSILIGIKKGLVGVAFKIVSFILAIIISLVLFKPISAVIINNTKIDDNIKSTISQFLGENDDFNIENVKETTEAPDFVIDAMYNMAKEEVEKGKSNVVDIISTELSRSVIELCVIIIMYIVLKIILLLLKKIFEKVADLPILKQFNKAGGFLYGFIKGFVIVYVILAIITIFGSSMGSGEVVSIINESFITKMMYNNNLIMRIFI